MGLLINLVFLALLIYIAYLVITVAVRHGIDSSEVGKIIKQKNGYQEEKFYPKDDLDKDY
ncbi:hypothetical protein FH966_08315 [Lentibacillus cibarius]|uniref:Uncharacterized protein n=1 Tax=Lentibacillus cibarius TaxID=2583219 RepID=A0A549YIH6_9BACI|nr:hypothetical protein [Lentibacillus cibarius]TRM11686.1 hypothetical protein FH966_08315 [Lentibacillus cibarius]